MPYALMEGNEAIAWAAAESGCRFFAGYPITPATTIFNSMLKILPPLGGICIQGEDEIASIGYCLGASMAGLKTMTATSGPGISLYSEHISFAIGSEIPIVIVDVQRLGPSTGSATRGADGDIQFLRWGSSGGLPVIVLVPVDVSDCYTLTLHAFNLAEQFRCPVFIASNKEIAMTRENIDIDSLEKPAIIDRTSPPTNHPFLPFEVAADRVVPYFLPIGGDILVRQTSSTHGPDGYITTDYDNIAKNQERLHKKLASGISRFSFHETILAENADTLLLAYGVSARAARDVYRKQKNRNRPVSLLILKTLWPVPDALIRETARKFKRVVVVEMNLGQYVREVQRILPDKSVEFIGQMDGRLINPRQIEEAIYHV
ncbi:MAG: pyruvate flavodoxin/ferredoxin oxidoreductase [Desulfobacterales bacterium]|nr:MAG: pyruvate flavodoxin/ferredoxin oxidoreductase [Desulfobacterales bacterium]UCD89106.1 MAG: pyruvate flavodoxin/ferredoxin oxidoreductase [Desulfobacterales bacterium]